MQFKIFGFNIETALTVWRDEITIGVGLRVRRNYWQKLEVALALGIFVINIEKED